MRNVSESPLKLEKIWNCAITETKNEAGTWHCQLLESWWRFATDWRWSLSAGGDISEIEQRSTASICPRKQPQASRIRPIPRHAHDRAKSWVWVCTISLRARTGTRSIPYKIQQPRFCPAPLTMYSGATAAQGDKRIQCQMVVLEKSIFFQNIISLISKI